MSVKDDIKKVSEKIKKELTKAIDRKLYDQIGKEASQLIRTRTRLGKGVSEVGSFEKLKKLEGSTKKTRRKFKENLSELTTPNRSNLTATGQMLDAITHKPTQKNVTITISGSRDRELTINYSTKSNKRVADNVQKNGRVFFKLANVEITEIRRTIEQLLKEIIKKQL